ncbi:single-stranded DNA-binding protein [Staphylococcus pseudintermedius]|uniref:DHH family phosphoesterase n=1 Tax=Staphylococcus pseudintermedius TaxID=283734 RepID=UPI0019DD61D5|nr:DHH family phosphoesterase [Staphylococcus pseudintermedius]EGQ3388992.1 single-stranded DNA-binding protein [Staphylococcus pseudintermedius]EGQ3727803.1 single-stranded DNA-binding protein [Staphylococcus pseudintermedius]EGQ3794360.1 single-stranded DNA-binding protein [Staphylococcus pseudintermedius]EHT8099303.1 single-stranded DNA-binding protein [Staphylococcus pseudintermedius]EIT1273701.1 single-stranded DNA-binding protein [Staphylococcus pseudintermedius]
MKVKLKSDVSVDNSVEQVLMNRGIKSNLIKSYLSPQSHLMPDYSKLKNIETAIELLNKHVKNKSKIALTVDVDMDGLTSTGIVYKYLVNYIGYDKELIKLIMPKGKIHGILVDRVLNEIESGDLLIVTDAGSSDFKEHKQLHEQGISCIVVDHHLASEEETPAIIVNNQLSPEFENKGLTGSAMAYLFCTAYSDKYELKEPKELLDLAAIGLVADRADFSVDLGAYYMMRSGLKKQNIHSKLLKKVIEKNGNMEEDTDLNATDIGFNVAPIFNSVFRMGKPEEVEQVIHGMCEFDYELYNSRKKIKQSIIEEAYLRAMAVKRRQKKQEDEVMEKIKERIDEKGSDRFKILIVNANGIIEDNGLTGLVAMKLVREYNKPVLLVKQKGELFKGSARNLSNSPIKDLNKFLTDTGKFVCRGHANAFGVEFKLDDALEIQSLIESELISVDFDDVEYEVDFIWSNFVDMNAILDLAEQKDMWCNGIDEPLIYLKNIYMKKSDFNFIGKTGNTLKLQVQGVDCIKFRISEDEKSEIALAEDTVYIDMVCTASVNSYKGRNTPQLLIQDFTIKSAQEKVDSALCLDDLPF